MAHIGYFREAFVARRAWMDERGYADLVALCQMLPGPTSSQAGIGIGLTKAGLAGAVAAWVGFTAPSAIWLIALGYGVVAFDDAIPSGPLFTFSAYLGTVMETPPAGWVGGLICLAAIFVPSFLLVIGTLPYWNALRRLESARRAMPGINAAVVGLLLAALYDPVWTSSVRSAGDFIPALAAFALLVSWKVPPWLVVILGAVAGWAVEVLAG